MGKKHRKTKKHKVDIYTAADLASYTLSFATYIAASYSFQLSKTACSLIAGSTALSLLAASNHASPFISSCNELIKNINVKYKGIEVNKGTIGEAYGIVNSITKSCVSFAFTTALTPCLTNALTKHLAANSTFLAPAIALASAAAVGSTITYAFNRIETDYFKIPKNEFKVGAAGAAQQRFLERIIFNGVKPMVPWGWGYTASAAAGLSSVILAKAYGFAGLDTVIHKDQNFFKNPILAVASNAASHIGKMALETWYSQTR